MHGLYTVIVLILGKPVYRICTVIALCSGKLVYGVCTIMIVFRKARVRYELNLALVLILLVSIMVICNLPRLLLNFLEYFQLDNILR